MLIIFYPDIFAMRISIDNYRLFYRENNTFYITSTPEKYKKAVCESALFALRDTLKTYVENFIEIKILSNGKILKKPLNYSEQSLSFCSYAYKKKININYCILIVFSFILYTSIGKGKLKFLKFLNLHLDILNLKQNLWNQFLITSTKLLTKKFSVNFFVQVEILKNIDQ